MWIVPVLVGVAFGLAAPRLSHAASCLLEPTMGGYPNLAPGVECTLPSAVTPVIIESTFNEGGLGVNHVGSNGILSSSVSAFLPLGKAKVDVCHDNTFFVKGIPTIPGALPTSTVSARISGNIAANGFAAIAGMGEGQIIVFAQVIDQGCADAACTAPGTLNRVIHSDVIINDEFSEILSPTIAVSGEIDIGSITAFIGGVSVGLGSNIPLSFHLISRRLPFGFDVPLKRGNFYTVRVRATSYARLLYLGGLVQLTFISPTVAGDAYDDVLAPKLMDPDIWIRASGFDVSKIAIPDIGLDDLPFLGSDLFTFPELEFHIGSIIDADVQITPALDIPNPLLSLPSSHELLDGLGLPKDLKGLIDEVFAIGEFGLKRLSAIPGDILPNSGVEVTDLNILVEPDAGELALHAEIESNLGRWRSPNAWYQLPEAHGGLLEKARAIVADHINRNIDAGYDMTKALSKLNAGDDYYSVGDWKRAYEGYRGAYREVTGK